MVCPSKRDKRNSFKAWPTEFTSGQDRTLPNIDCTFIFGDPPQRHRKITLQPRNASLIAEQNAESFRLSQDVKYRNMIAKREQRIVQLEPDIDAERMKFSFLGDRRLSASRAE